MTNQDFLAEIVSNPLDPLPRYVYADWLEEQGDPRAEHWRQPLVLTPLFAGDGYGIGYGNGYGTGNGYGDGYGYGTGNGYGDGYGYGIGNGGGYGDGNGGGLGDGYGYGTGNGNGYGDGYGYGYISGGGYGGGLGDDYGDGNYLGKEYIVKGKYILICSERWVHVGDARPDPDDHERLILDNCYCCRWWGTTRGLGQLAREGPQAESELDPEGDGVSFLRRDIKRAIPCNPEAWQPAKGAKSI